MLNNFEDSSEKDIISFENNNNDDEKISQFSFELWNDKINKISPENKDLCIDSFSICLNCIFPKKKENKSITKNNISTTISKPKNLKKKCDKIFNIIKINKNKGRIPIKKKNIINFPKHNRFSQDNIIQVIKVKFLVNCYDLINILYEKDLKSLNETDNRNVIKLIRRISPKEYKKIKKADNLKWFSSKLKDIFSFEISSKYKNYDKDYNKKQIESLYSENKAKNVIDILEKTVREMYYVYSNDIFLEGFKTLKNDIDELRKKKVRDGEDYQSIQKYLDKYKQICCNLENLFLKKKPKKKITKKFK